MPKVSKLIALAVVLIAVLFAGSAEAQCRNRNVNRNLGLQQIVAGNQLITIDRFGRVVDRQFIRGNNLSRAALNRALFRVDPFGRNSLEDRLLLGL